MKTDRAGGERARPGRPLHLLIVSNTQGSPHISGGDRDWVNLLNALGAGSVRVTWAGVRDAEMLGQYLEEGLVTRFVDLGFQPFYGLFHSQMYQRRTLPGWGRVVGASVRGLRRPLELLGRAVAEDPPDVVVTNTSVVLVGAAYALRHRLPHIWCVKEFLDPSVRACRNYARLIERLSRAVVVPSEAMAGVFSPRARVLRDGSDLAAVRAGVRAGRAEVLKALRLPAGQLVIAQVGAISRAKGQRVTAQAFALLAREERPPCSLLFLGPALPEEQAELRGALAGAPEAWRESVRFAEFGPGDFSHVAAADVIAHPSVLPDPYPNAVREALILGKPVVGTRVGGIPRLVADGETGLLVEPDDAPALAAALRTLLDAPERRARMGEAALRFAADELDVNVRKEAFRELLLEVSGRGGAIDKITKEGLN